MVLCNFLYMDLIYYMFCICCFIPVWVFFVLGWQLFSNYNLCSLLNESNLIEFVWTVVPTVLIGVLCLFNLQCLVGEGPVALSGVVKIIGRQWYWSYEIVGLENCYDSFILDFIDSVDKPLRLFLYTPYCLLITSSDVIHSFALPNFSIKVDAIPGRVNQAFLMPACLGVYTGYCSELCGAGHAYMPIVVEVVKKGLCF